MHKETDVKVDNVMKKVESVEVVVLEALSRRGSSDAFIRNTLLSLLKDAEESMKIQQEQNKIQTEQNMIQREQNKMLLEQNGELETQRRMPVIYLGTGLLTAV